MILFIKVLNTPVDVDIPKPSTINPFFYEDWAKERSKNVKIIENQKLYDIV